MLGPRSASMASAGGCPRPPPPWCLICAAGLSPASSAALQALRLPPPHPSPSCAAGSLASARGPRTARTPQARRPLGSSGTGQRCCSRSHGVLTRRAHTARSYTAYAQLNASRRRRAHTFSSLEAQARSDEIMALPSVPQQEGRWATARASTARSEVNYFPSVSARQAGRVRRARSVCRPCAFDGGRWHGSKVSLFPCWDARSDSVRFRD